MRKVGRPKKEDQVDLLDQLQKIHKKFGGITPAKVVSEAKRKRHPLHKYFDWEDTEAAKKWRLHQANSMISRVQIIVSPQDKRTVNAFVSISDDDNRRFVAMAEAMISGVPILASKVGLCLEILGNGEYGYFFEQGSHKDLALKIFEMTKSLSCLVIKSF